ncbi:FERM and PDZ domain-containing protein 4-like isoform X2 [Stigmatopora argus]
MDMFGFSKMQNSSSHKSKTSGWPPPGSWGGLQGPPYSWDSMNCNREGQKYLTNQVSQNSSLEEVHLDGLPPVPRLVEMRRDPVLGFGFVAGSEKPVVVRSVTPGGPSEGKLLPGDEIIMINDEPVSSAPRERVIDLVRSCKESIQLTVVQPYPSPKSAFISAAKKAMLKSNPVKVRFAEEVIINGQVPNPVKDNSLLFMPNVLKVYLEIGHTKSFRFDCSTSIKDVILTLQEKLSIKCIEHFSLMLEEKMEGSANRLLLLHEQEMLAQVTRRPGCEKMKCFFRISFMPRDPVELLRRDAVAFEYLYVQSCNDVVLERFGSELKYDAVLRLAALQMYILTLTTKQSQKVSLKYIQKEWGLSLFLPPAVLTSTKEKNIKKALTHILKTNQNLVPPGKKLTVLQAKVHYLRYLSELKLYGGREFQAILLQVEKQIEVTLLVGPRYGISHVINARTNLVALLADFSHVNRIEILTEDQDNVRLELHVLDVRPITLIMESSDAMNLACLTAGYYRLLVDSRRSIFNMVHCGNAAGDDDDDDSQDRVLEWPYSTSFGDSEELSRSRPGLYGDSQYLEDERRRENSFHPNFRPAQNPDGDFRSPSPLPPPLPPATRHKPQDSPRSAKVSFIFGGDPPPNKPGSLAFQRLRESDEVAEHGPPRYLHNANFEAQDRMSFHLGGLTHIYSNINDEGSEEPLLRDLFYRDATDEAEDEDEASCEEDSAGGTPSVDGRGGEGVATAAGKASFLMLSGPTDDIIDLTSLPPPEGDDTVDDDESDSLLESLNLAIAAPPPGFRDSSDEDAAPEGRLLSPDRNDDIPVSLIDAIPTPEEAAGEEKRRLENTVVNTLQALEALAVNERRPPPPRPPSGRNNPGVYTSHGFSPESSSDSGNETNSSEMTELSELAACHRLSESHMRLLVATREGYQPLLEEKTEFPVSPGTEATTQKKSRTPQHLRPPAVPPRRSPHLDSVPSLRPDCPSLRSETPNLSSTLQRPNSTTPGGKHHKKSADSSGKYNTFSTREGYQSGSVRREGHQHVPFCDRGGSYRRHNLFLEDHQDQDVNNHPDDRPRIPRPPPIKPDGLTDMGTLDCAIDNRTVEQDEHLVVASLLSPGKSDRSGASEQASEIQNDHQSISRQQSVARLCEYHLAKRISNLQGEAHSSLQGSLCSSLDVGGSANSSVCATPTDSPLGSGATESKHHHLQRHAISSSSSSLLRVVNYEEFKPGQNPQAKDIHPHADPVLLRKMLPNIHNPSSGPELVRPSSATPSKHKETMTGKKPFYKNPNQKEGSEAYRQLINYLTVSQMHQGGKLHSAGMGGGVKKDTRRYITSNPQLVEMVKNRGNTLPRCQCIPSAASSAFVRPNFANPNGSHLTNKDPKTYHAATLPAKLKRNPETYASNNRLDVRQAHGERRSSFSGLQSNLERNAPGSDHFLPPFKRDGVCELTAGRPPPRSRSQPSCGVDDWCRTDPRERRTPIPPPSGSRLGGQRADLDGFSLGRGPSAFRQTNPVGGVSSPSPPQPPALPPPVPIPGQPCAPPGNSVRTPESFLPNQNHVRAVNPSPSMLDPLDNFPQRGRELKRSSSNVTNGSGSAELLFEKANRRPPSPSAPQPGETKVQRRPARKRLSKSYSQGSVSSHTTCWSSGVDCRRASVAFPVQKDKQPKGSQKLDTSPWRCNGPFSYCFFKRKSEGEDDDNEWDAPRRSRAGTHLDNERAALLAIFPCGSALDAAGEQLYGEVLDNMSFSDRLSRVNTLKDRMYSSPSGFADVRRDAGELIALVRSSIGRCDRGVQIPGMQEVSQSKQLLSVESKELGRACRRMAQAYGSPEEMLLAVTYSFQVLCCLCEACMCLVKGLSASASHQQREVVAKVDEVVMNYICLLKAAEVATVAAPGEHSVKALVRHSSTMSAIANALTRSLKTLLSK